MSNRPFIIFKAIIYMLMSGIPVVMVKFEQWIAAPPVTDFELTNLYLATALAMLTVLKSFMSDSNVEPTDKNKQQEHK